MGADVIGASFLNGGGGNDELTVRAARATSSTAETAGTRSSPATATSGSRVGAPRHHLPRSLGGSGLRHARRLRWPAGRAQFAGIEDLGEARARRRSRRDLDLQRPGPRERRRDRPRRRQPDHLRGPRHRRSGQLGGPLPPQAEDNWEAPGRSVASQRVGARGALGRGRARAATARSLAVARRGPSRTPHPRSAARSRVVANATNTRTFGRGARPLRGARSPGRPPARSARGSVRGRPA